MRKLPPLNSIRVFEQTCRYRSFQEAANALCVTKSAISKQIHHLEHQMGISLFKKEGRNLVLTGPGKEYFSVVSKAMDLLENASAAYYHDTESAILRINVAPSLSNDWIHKAIAAFNKDYPSISIKVFSEHIPTQWAERRVDLSISSDDLLHNFKGQKHFLFKGNLLAIAHSELLENYGIATLNCLSKLPLIVTENNEDAWSKVYKTCISNQHPPAAKYQFQHDYMTVCAVNRKLGIGIAPSFLVEHQIRSNELVNPFDLCIEGVHQYFLFIPSHKIGCRGVQQFSNWLLEFSNND